MTFMHKQVSIQRMRLVTAICAPLLGCALDGGAETEAPQHADARQPLIGGFPATSAALNAVGTMSMMHTDEDSGEPEFDFICSAALIDKDLVVTTKHCIDAARFVSDSNSVLVFTLGPDASAPVRAVPVLETQMAPGDVGGFTGFGHDIAVLHLGEKVNEVKPLLLASVEERHLGESFIAIGYGATDNAGEDGLRRMGPMHLKARTGRTYEALLGSFDAFFAWYAQTPVPTDCDQSAPLDPFLCEYLEHARTKYESTLLEPTAEVVAGGAPGDAQTCYGDSGGPLMRAVDGRFVAYGIAIGGIDSRTLLCDHGAVYASFSPEVMGFFEEAMAWKDPCASLPAMGVCAGTVAQRCTTRLEGARRKAEFDCASVGLRCETQSDGSVGCGADEQPLADR